METVTAYYPPRSIKTNCYHGANYGERFPLKVDPEGGCVLLFKNHIAYVGIGFQHITASVAVFAVDDSRSFAETGHGCDSLKISGMTQKGRESVIWGVIERLIGVKP